MDVSVVNTLTLYYWSAQIVYNHECNLIIQSHDISNKHLL